MLLKIYNKSLIQDREKTYLTAAVAASATTLTVSDTDLAPAGSSSNTWADNDYMIVGNIGEEGTEVMQMNAAVTSATSLTIDREGQAGGLRLAHPIGTPVYRIDFNRAIFYNNSTDTTVGASTLATINLQVDDHFTRYEDTANTTGYGFVRFNNATSGAFSSYSDGVNYEVSGQSSSQDPRTLWMLRKKVRKLLDEDSDSKLKDSDIDASINDKQRDIAHRRLWSFFEIERSMSIVANQFAYDIPTTIQKIHSVRINTQPLVPMNKTDWDFLHFNTNQSMTTPNHVTIWNNQLLLSTRPSTAANTTTLGAAITTATATSITVVSSSTFKRGDYYRFIIDSEVIYATVSTATTFTGCLRGQEGTTATTHLIAATVTERNIVYNGHVEPTDLIDTQDRTPIPEAEVVALGAAIDLALFVGKQDLIPTFEPRYAQKVKELESKYLTKQSGYFGRVKPAEQVISTGRGSFDNPNNYPAGIIGT